MMESEHPGTVASSVDPMPISPEDYPPEELSPELRALAAMRLVLVLAAVLGVGYVAAPLIARWLV